MSFKDKMAHIRESVKGFLNSDNVEAITALSKELDGIEAEYETARKAESDAKENLVKYVKEYAFDKPLEDSTHTEESPSLDDLITKEFANK